MATSERAMRVELANRLRRKIGDLVSNIAGRQFNSGDQLPELVHVIVEDDDTRTRWGGFVRVTHYPNGMFGMENDQLGQINPDWSLGQYAGMLTRTDPGVPLICEEEIAKELFDEGTSWQQAAGGHYRLIGVFDGEGLIDVYTPYNSMGLSSGTLQPGVRGQFYLE